MTKTTEEKELDALVAAANKHAETITNAEKRAVVAHFGQPMDDLDEMDQMVMLAWVAGRQEGGYALSLEELDNTAVKELHRIVTGK